MSANPKMIQPVEVRVCRVEELPQGIGRAFELAGKSIAIFRARSGEVHAVENRCPHKGGPLADGIVVGSQIVCPMHSRRYSLKDGACEQSGDCGINAFQTRVEDGSVVVSLSVESSIVTV